MEVACSFDEFAQVLAEDGYINDASYFNDAPDLPSMLRVFESKTGLDSPESFPESPCSDEDIARVLEITQMSSPSLLESCLPDSFADFPTPHNNVLDVDNVCSVTKTRDPCITNAVLHDIFRNTTPANYPGRPPTSLEGFCLPSNVFSNSVSVNLNHIIDAKENDSINTSYFDSTPVLSPLSEADTIPDTSSYQDQLNLTNAYVVQVNLGNVNVQQTLETETETSTTGNTGVGLIRAQDETKVTNSTQKRKRKRKSYSKSSKSKKGKNKNTNSSPKQPKPKKVKTSDEKTQEKQTKSSSTKKQSNLILSLSQLEPPEGKEQCTSTQPQPETNNSTANDQKEETTLRRSSRSTRNTENYDFRLSSLVKRVETERRQKEPKQPKDKAKPPPLSKYRRRTANARERDRMKEINDAFETLKESLPAVEDENKQKMTKFTILKYALNYISALRDMLGYDELVPSIESFDLMSSQNSVSSESLDAECPSNSDSVSNLPLASNKPNVPSSLADESSPSLTSTCSTSKGNDST